MCEEVCVDFVVVCGEGIKKDVLVRSVFITQDIDITEGHTKDFISSRYEADIYMKE